MATKQGGKNSEKLSAAIKATQLGEEERDLNLALSGCHAVGMAQPPKENRDSSWYGSPEFNLGLLPTVWSAHVTPTSLLGGRQRGAERRGLM